MIRCRRLAIGSILTLGIFNILVGAALRAPFGQ
jgi:hypothetical protein